jgi:hypothetical protein
LPSRQGLLLEFAVLGSLAPVHDGYILSGHDDGAETIGDQRLDTSMMEKRTLNMKGQRYATSWKLEHSRSPLK